MEFKYWREIFDASREKVEEIYSKQEQMWDTTNEKLQLLVLPSFGAFKIFKEQAEIISEVEDSIFQDQLRIGKLVAVNQSIG